MKIPKVLHPILGVLIAAILFLAGIAVSSILFVGTCKAVAFAKPYLVEIFKLIHQWFTQI